MIGRAGPLLGGAAAWIERDVLSDIVASGGIEANHEVGIFRTKEMRSVGAGHGGDVAGEGEGLALAQSPSQLALTEMSNCEPPRLAPIRPPVSGSTPPSATLMKESCCARPSAGSSPPSPEL